MALEEIDLMLPSPPEPLPKKVAELVLESDRRVDAFFHAELNRRLPRYLPGDTNLLYAAMKSITDRDLPLGRVYCEWGSGFGIGTCLASLMGYEAWGIEIEPQLTGIAEQLADDLGIEAKFLNTSYLPEGFESYEGVGGEVLVRDDGLVFGGGASDFEPIYEGMDREICDIDVFHVYPWPYQQEFMHHLFEALAVEGAILVTYLGSGEITAYRKLGDEDDDDDDES